MSKREERRIGLSLLPTELAQLVQLLTNKHLDGENLFNSQDIFYISPELVEYYADHFHIDYRGRLYEFPPGESEVERIEAKMSDQTFVRDREQMAKNFQYVVDALHKKRYDGFDFVSRLKNIFIDVKAEQIERMGRSDQFSEDEIQDEKKLLESLRRDQALFTHLRESTQSTKNALNSLEAIRKRRETPPQISEQETPRLLTTRQQLLLTKVAVPLHDLAKLLGSTKQIDPDHENAMQFLLEKFGVGQMIPGKKGQEGILTQDDVEFISLFISSHEDIYRERWFEELAKGFGEELDTTKVNDPVAIDRAVSFFHIFDIFGNAAKIIDKGNGTGTFTIDFEEGQDGKSEFDKRFLDLYQRHMYLDDVGGWNKGKAWRPEWGVYAIRSVINTVRGLEQFGVKMEEGLVGRIREKMVSKIDQALAAIQQAGKTEELIAKVEELKKERQMMEKIGSEDISFHVTQSLLPTRGGNMSAETPTEAMAAEAVQAPEKQEEIVDPEEWYEELEEAGYPKVMLKKIALVKMRIVTQDEEGQEAIVSQDKTSSKKIVGEVMIQNVHADGTEHEGEKEYGFGNKKDTLPKRNQDFHDKYEEIPDMKGYFRKKGDQAVVGIQVPVTKRIKVNWTDKGAEIKVGGYLINGGKDNYYPINPDSLWGYEILEKEDDDD